MFCDMKMERGGGVQAGYWEVGQGRREEGQPKLSMSEDAREERCYLVP